MIFCDISKIGFGGLGNNLFKIAACLSLSKKNNVECKLSKWRYDVFENLNFVHDRSEMDINFCYNEPFFPFSIIQYVKNMEVNGHFQSEKYFKDFEKDIRFCFTPKRTISEYIEDKYKNILNIKSVAVHVRRGNYLMNDCHPVLNIEYYFNAIDFFKKKYDIDKFIIFSDDIEWCKSNFIGDEFYFIQNEKDYVDLFLMSKCSHCIIANSTFSWWGAWLNNNIEKKIIYPSLWFSGGNLCHNTKDLIPSNWTFL